MDKAFIIAAIKKIASENGGTAPGARRFASMTGIKQSDWSGKYWARWSDALSEAGLPSNTFSEAYDDNFLLGKLAELVRDIGRFPVKAELRMRARGEANFPSCNTFVRFGDKPQRIARLQAYCATRPELSDVASICTTAAAETVTTGDNSEPESQAEDTDFGYVYLLKSGRFHKIGRTNSLGRREYELSIQLPEKVSLVHEISTDDPVGIEAYWHKRFEGRRKNGEWFELTPQDIKAFRRRKFM